MTSLTRLIQVVEAVRRIPAMFKGITFFSERDVWKYESVADERRCPICRELAYAGEVRGLHLRKWFGNQPYADLVILDADTLGGPEPNGNGLMHPNCRCRLKRKKHDET